jgi:hypothetical protein
LSQHYIEAQKEEMDITLPVIELPDARGRRATQGVLHKQNYPDVFGPDAAGGGSYQPETEAEIVMNELWLARRRQEVINVINWNPFNDQAI